MLVLSRLIGEKIHVGDSIVVEVRRISGSRVHLAVDAPRNVRVLRGELLASPPVKPISQEGTPDHG